MPSYIIVHNRTHPRSAVYVFDMIVWFYRSEWCSIMCVKQWFTMLFGGKNECLVMEAPLSTPEREREKESW